MRTLVTEEDKKKHIKNTQLNTTQ